MPSGAVGVSSLVQVRIQQALACETNATLNISRRSPYDDAPPLLTAIDARGIVECLQDNPRFHTLKIRYYSLHDDVAAVMDVLNVFRHGLPRCTSLTTVHFYQTGLGNEGLQRLLPVFL
jgi:hypothetical protein